MSLKKLKRRRKKLQSQAVAARVQAAYAKAADAVNVCHPESLTWGFVVGLSSLALGAGNPAIAMDWRDQSHDRKLEGLDLGAGITSGDQEAKKGSTSSLSTQAVRTDHMLKTTRSHRFAMTLAAREEDLSGSSRHVDIPPGNLQAALLKLSEQVGLQLLYPSKLVEGLETRGLQGTHTPEKALEKVLNGTGLEYIFADALTATLKAEGTLDGSNAEQAAESQQKDDAVILADPIVVEETIKRSKVFLPPVDGYKADQTTSTTRTALPISETPSSIGVVTRDIIRDTLSRTQNDAFEQVSGVSRGNSRLGRGETFNIRGFNVGTIGGDFSSIRQNGLPIDSAFAPDPAIIERYEIIKGPTSIAGGASNPGGFVNRMTKTPQETNFLKSDFLAGSFDLYRGVVDANGVLPQYKNVRGRLIFAVEDGGNFVDQVDVRQYTVAPSLEMDLFGGAGTLLLTGHYQNFDGTSFPGFPLLVNGEVPDIPRTRNFGGGSDNGAKTTFEGQNYELHYVHEFINNLTLSVKGRYAHSDLSDKILYSFVYGGLPLSGDSYMSGALRRSDIETFAGEIFLSKEFEALGQKHEVLVGFDHRDQNRDFLFSYVYVGGYATDNIFNPANNFQLPSDAVFEAAASSKRTTDLVQTGVFGQVVARPTQRLTMVGAFRHDWADTKNRDILNNTILKEDYSKLTGRVGTIYELFPGIRVYAGFAQSFQVNANDTTVDGSLLPPETGENYEVGAKLDLLDGRVRLTTALFRTYRQNVATTDPTNINFSLAIGEQRHQGVEFDINGQLWPGLILTGNVSYIDAEITKDNTPGFAGSTPIQIPRSYVGRIFATYELQSGPLQGLGFGGGVFFQSGFELTTPNRIGTDAYERVDAIVFYRPPKKAYEFTINVRNLLDKTYIETPGLLNSYNQFGAPLTVVGSLRVAFSPDLDLSFW